MIFFPAIGDLIDGKVLSTPLEWGTKNAFVILLKISVKFCGITAQFTVINLLYFHIFTGCLLNKVC